MVETRNEDKILSVRFNQGKEYIIVGTNRGFFRFDSTTGECRAQREFFPENSDPQQKIEETEEQNMGIYDSQPMYKSNISVLIENRNKHSLLLWDDHNARIFTEKAIDETEDV